MEAGYDFTLSGKIIVIEANLRDLFFWKLVRDFRGQQTGEGLGLNDEPCKNRLLIQAGLLREDYHLTWSAMVEWLQKIVPKHHSANFQGLIETGIATALTLGSNAMMAFLESEINFKFVGPICDSIGVETPDLLEMRDFSAQAQSIEVTNGLILELNNFVVREKIDPTALVTWLRNFNPMFCKDGDILKAYKTFRPKVKKLKLQYRNYKTRTSRRNSAMEILLHSLFELVPAKDTGRKFNGKKRMKKETSFNEEKVKIKEECDVLIMQQEKYFPHLDTTIKEENIPVSIGNDQDMDVSDRSGESKESSDTNKESLCLLDIAMITIKQLKSVYGGKTDIFKKKSAERIKNLYAFTCRENPDMEQFESNILSLSEDVPLASPFKFIYQNACFLVDMYDAIEQQLMAFEQELTQSTGEKLGRDKDPKFKRFVNFSESATSRYVHMAWDLLSPQGPSHQNYRKHWVAFCEEKGNPSMLDIDQSNSFSSYFEVTAGIVHHHKEIQLFLSDLLLMHIDDCSNIILESINADAADNVIQSLVCVLAILHCKIVGPYYQLLRSRSEYARFSQYILCLYQKLLEWSKCVLPLLKPEEAVNVFLQDPVQERTFDGVFHYCGRWHTNRDLIGACLKKMVKVIAGVTEQHLLDFLPGGVFCYSSQSEICLQLASCTFSFLMREYPFDDMCPYEKKQSEYACEDFSEQDSSSSSSEEDDSSSDLSDMEHDKCPARPHINKVRGGQRGRPPNSRKPWSLDDCNERSRGITAKHHSKNTHKIDLIMDRKYIIATVSKNGGPCKTQQDVDKLLLRFDGKPRIEKREALRCEIVYQKIVLDNDNPILNDPSTSFANKLKLALPRVKPGYSFVLGPRLTKPKSIPINEATVRQTGSEGVQAQPKN